MKNTDLEQSTALIGAAFEFPAQLEINDENELIMALSDRIEYMLAHSPDMLMSMLYRLDVLEVKIIPVMHPAAPEPVHIGLAKLVYARQLERINTKRTVKSKPLEGIEDWDW